MMRAAALIGAMLLTTASLAASQSRPSAAGAPAPRVIPIKVTDAGFVPAEIKAQEGLPLELVVTRTTDATCVRELVIQQKGIRVALPLNKPVKVAFTPDKAGRLRYACGMDMVSGVIIVD